MNKSQAHTLALCLRSEGVGDVITPTRFNADAPADYGWGILVDGVRVTAPSQLARLRSGTFTRKDQRFVVRLTSAQMDALRTHALKQSMAINDAIAAAIDAYLSNRTD